MKKKLIISERQFDKLNKFINEDSHYGNMVGEIVDHLEMNYKKAIENYRDGNEYKTRKVFEIKADGDLISPKDLVTYIKSKFSVGDSFVKQLIDDWCNNTIKDGKLSKNVELSK